MERREGEHELWTIGEFSDFVRVTIGAARAMIRRGELPEKAVLRIGRRIRLRSALVRRWLGERAA